MTERMILTGAEFNNSNMPKWATDATLREIEENVLELVKIVKQKNDIKSTNNTKSKKIREENEKSLIKLTQEQKKSEGIVSKIFKRQSQAAESASDAVEKMRASLMSGFSGPSSLLNVLQGGGKLFMGLLNPVTFIGTAMFLAGTAVTKFTDYLIDSVQASRSLYDSGIGFTRGLADIRLAAANAVMPLDQFAKMLEENSALVVSFGENGATAIGSLTKGAFKLNEQQGLYGMSIQEHSEYILDFMETQRLQGRLQSLSELERMQVGAEYTKNLTEASQILGKSRKQIHKEMQEQLKRPDVGLILNQLDESVRPGAVAAFNKASMMISGMFGEQAGQVNDLFARLIVGANDYNDDMIKVLQTVDGRLADEFIDIANSIERGTITEEQAEERMRSFGKGLQGLSETQWAVAKDMIAAGSNLSGGATALFQLKQTLEQANLDDKGIKPAPTWVTMMQKLATKWAELQSHFSGIIAKFIDKLDPWFEKIGNMLQTYSGVIEEFMQKVFLFVERLLDPATQKQAIEEISNKAVALFDLIFDRINAKINPFSKSFYTGPKDLKEIEARNASRANQASFEEKRSQYGVSLIPNIVPNVSNLYNETTRFWKQPSTTHKITETIETVSSGINGVSADVGLFFSRLADKYEATVQVLTEMKKQNEESNELLAEIINKGQENVDISGRMNRTMKRSSGIVNR